MGYIVGSTIMKHGSLGCIVAVNNLKWLLVFHCRKARRSSKYEGLQLAPQLRMLRVITRGQNSTQCFGVFGQWVYLSNLECSLQAWFDCEEKQRAVKGIPTSHNQGYANEVQNAVVLSTYLFLSCSTTPRPGSWCHRCRTTLPWISLINHFEALNCTELDKLTWLQNCLNVFNIACS